MTLKHCASRKILRDSDRSGVKLYVNRTSYFIDINDMDDHIELILKKYEIRVPNNSLIEIKSDEHIARKIFKTNGKFKDLSIDSAISLSNFSKQQIQKAEKLAN